MDQAQDQVIDHDLTVSLTTARLTWRAITSLINPMTNNDLFNEAKAALKEAMFQSKKAADIMYRFGWLDKHKEGLRIMAKAESLWSDAIDQWEQSNPR